MESDKAEPRAAQGDEKEGVPPLESLKANLELFKKLRLTQRQWVSNSIGPTMPPPL
jgi:hypothetical protein